MWWQFVVRRSAGYLRAAPPAKPSHPARKGENVSAQPKLPAAGTDTAYDSAEEIRAAVNQVMELVAIARMRPNNFADIYATFDNADLLTEIREELDGLACWLVPTVKDLDRAYIRRLPPEERDELPSTYVAGAH